MSTTADARDAIFMRIITDEHVDPRPLYHELREVSPLYKTPFGFWWALDYETARAVMTDRSTWTVDADHSASGGVPNPERFAMQTWARCMIVVDGDVHTRLRDIVKEIFKPASVRSMRSRMTETVQERIAELADRDEFDLRWDFAEHLPTRVTLDLLGIDTSHLELFANVAESLAQIMEPDAPDETLAWGDQIWSDAAAVVLATADERRDDPRDDLMTALLRAEADGERLSRDELVSMVLLIAVAGQETTGQMICSGVYHILNNPEQAAALRADRSLMANAIEETMRFEPATRVSGPRYALHDTELAGQKFAKGEAIMVVVPAANTDPTVFEDPLTFNILRPPSRHLGFGTGHHHCLGSSVARMEIEIVWNCLLDAFEEIEVDADLPWKPRFMVRGLQSLPMRVKPSRVVAGV